MKEVSCFTTTFCFVSINKICVQLRNEGFQDKVVVLSLVAYCTFLFKMRNRFKPTLSSSRSSPRSGTSLNENAGEDVSSSRSSANSKDKETAPRANKGTSVIYILKS